MYSAYISLICCNVCRWKCHNNTSVIAAIQRIEEDIVRTMFRNQVRAGVMWPE